MTGRMANTASSILLLAALGSGIVGCSAGVTRGPYVRNVVMVDGSTLRPVYPCANLALLARTPPHRWQDPCEARFSLFKIDGIYVLRHSRQPLLTPSYNPGYGSMLCAVHERCGNVLFAPGFNPSGNPRVILWDGVLRDDARSFWTEYKRVKKATLESGDLDKDYREAADALRAKAAAQGRVVLIPLHSSSDGVAGKERLLVNHSMLVFLLNQRRIWRDLRSCYRRGKGREAITLICRTVSLIAEAHRKKWPSHTWETRHKQIIEWCDKVATDAAEKG